VDQQDLPAFYNLAAVFLYPSQMEAFPIPITEALACGRPIITSNAYGLKELAGDAALLVDPGSVEDIVKALQDVLTNNELSATLSRNALNRSRLFSWDQCAGETLSILNRIGGQAV
jgi:glycosyltransferase involved in cell wall biosynthesis